MNVNADVIANTVHDLFLDHDFYISSNRWDGWDAFRGADSTGPMPYRLDMEYEEPTLHHFDERGNCVWSVRLPVHAPKVAIAMIRAAIDTVEADR